MGWLGVYLFWLMDILGFKSVSSKGFRKVAIPQHPEYVVYVAAREFMDSGVMERAKTLLEEFMKEKTSIRCGRLLIHILIRQKEYAQAADVASRLVSTHQDNPWPRLLYGDIKMFFQNDMNGAYQQYVQALELAKSSPRGKNPMKVAYKRICHILEVWERFDDLHNYLLEFVTLESSNFHDHEFDILVRGLLARDQDELARKFMDLGLKAYPRSQLLRDLWEEGGFGDENQLHPIPVRGTPPPSGINLIPVKTRLLLEGDDPLETLKQHIAAGKVHEADVVTLSSCVAGLMEGRIFMEGAVNPGFLARLLSRFVDQKDVPFGGAAPMANPLSMQVLLEQIGTVKTLFAGVAGAVGKLIGRKGWFYVIGGRDAGQIDDVLGSLPPYDYYVIMGPRDPFELSNKIAAAFSCHAAIVDANDLGVAWAVGYSDGLDHRWLEEVMSTNPAGNQEQKTPVVLVKAARQ